MSTTTDNENIKSLLELLDLFESCAASPAQLELFESLCASPARSASPSTSKKE